MKKNRDELNELLMELYKKWPDVQRFLSSLGCKKNAEDIFQEALVIFVRKKSDPSFELTVDPYYYVRNTCKLLWYNQSRKDGKHSLIELEHDVIALEDEWFQQEMKLRIVERVIEQLGKQCRQILQLFYGTGIAMSEIAQIVGLTNDKAAKAQKYRCLQKAKEGAKEIQIIDL
jgi:RNA polymerase sigma factor (sigma-70 family)